jgi:hypothetical protein
MRRGRDFSTRLPRLHNATVLDARRGFKFALPTLARARASQLPLRDGLYRKTESASERPRKWTLRTVVFLFRSVAKKILFLVNEAFIKCALGRARTRFGGRRGRARYGGGRAIGG